MRSKQTRSSSFTHRTHRSLRAEALESRQLLSVSPVSSEFLVNQTTTANQENARVAMDSSGNFVAVWQSAGQDGSGYGIYAQRYNSAGAPLGTEFKVNTYTTGDQTQPAIAMNASGAFVISWTSQNEDGNGQGVFAQRYNASGVAQGSEFQVNTFTTYDQNFSAVAINASGNFVITWQSGDQAGNPPSGHGEETGANTPPFGDFDYTGVYAREFNSSGTALTGEVHVNTNVWGAQAFPTVAMDSSSNFVVTWTSYWPSEPIGPAAQDGSGSGIYAQRFNSSGSKIGTTEFQVNTIETNNQAQSVIAMDGSGNFVIAWSSAAKDSSATHFSNIDAQRYDSSGNRLGGEFQVNTYSTGGQAFPAIAMDSTGNFIISWNSGVQTSNGIPAQEEDGSLYGIYAQRYNSSGVAQQTEFRANTYTTGNQAVPAIAMDGNGDFVIAWQSNSEDGSGYGVYAQRYDNNQNPIANAGGPYTIGVGGSVTLNAGASTDPEGQPLTYAWDIDGNGSFTDATGVSPTLTWAQLNSFGLTGAGSLSNVKVRVSDPYGGVTTSSATSITAANPTVNAGGPYTVTEGQSLALGASGSDPSGFPLTYSWDINNDNTFGDASGASPTLTWAQLQSFGINNGSPTSSYTIKVQVNNGQGGVSTATATVNVVNAPPSASIAGAAVTLRGVSQTFTLTATDPSTVDQAAGFTFSINWGDGSSPQNVTGASGATVAHVFNVANPTDTITVTATDQDGGTSSVSSTSIEVDAVQLVADAQNPSLTDLVWSGTAGNDSVQFQQAGPTSITVAESKINGSVVNNVQTFSGVTGRVIAYGQDANDTLDASGLATTSATLNGNAGNNTLLGGQAGDILIGGSNGGEGHQGNNVIIAGNGTNTIYGNDVTGAEGATGGNNIIIGGSGSDTIYGNFHNIVNKNHQPSNGGEGGQNIIVGGGGSDTLYAFQQNDPGPGANGAEGGHGSIVVAGSTAPMNQAALSAVMSEWTSSDPLATKMADIQGTGSGGANGTNYLEPGVTVFNDGSVDTLYGDTNGSADWFMYSVATDSVARSKAADQFTDTP